MLVLQRKLGESIMVGDDVEVHVTSIRGDKVRLAMNAPRNLAIHRKEIWTQIQKVANSKPVDGEASADE